MPSVIRGMFLRRLTLTLLALLVGGAGSLSCRAQDGGTLTLSGASNQSGASTIAFNGGTFYGGSITPAFRTLGAGSRDLGFGDRSGTDGLVYAVAVQPDGKIVVVGDFKSMNGVACGSIARLNADGSVDPSFKSGSGADDQWVKAVVVQPDGKLLVAGAFTRFNGVARPGIARLQADGSLDTGFAPGAMNRVAWPEAVIGGPNGGYASLNGSTVITTGGTIILTGGGLGLPGYTPPVPQDTLIPGGQVNAVVLQPDGKVVIGGIFAQVGGVTRYNLARLNADGTLDTGFDPGPRENNGSAYNYASVVSALALQKDGRLLVAGNDSGTNNGVLSRLVRLGADGSADGTFQPVTTSSAAPLYTGYAGSSNGYSYYDYHFADTSVPNVLGLQAVLVLPGGDIVAAGVACRFDLSGGQQSDNVARFHPDGTPDNGFVASLEDRGVYSVALQADGKLVLGGSYRTEEESTYGQITWLRTDAGVVRLNADGRRDEPFQTVVGSDWTGYAVAVQADGKVLVGGDFYGVEGGESRGVARLNPTSPTVTLTASTAKISRAAGEKATLTFTRSESNASQETEVAYAVGGTLQNGVDYKKLSGNAVIKAGQTSRTVHLKPLADGVRGKVTVMLTASDGVSYEVDNPTAVQVKIGK